MRNYPFYIIVCLSLSLLLLFNLVLPGHRNLSFLRGEILKKEFELQSQEEYFQRLQEVSEELKKEEDSLLKIESALPPNPALPELLNFIQKAASQSGLTLENISPTLVASAKEIKETKINLILIGDYLGLKSFLSIVERSARLVEIENIYFSYPTRGGPFNFNLTIMVHSY